MQTDEQRKTYIAGLIRELRGYEAKGDEASAEGVRAELRRNGVESYKSNYPMTAGPGVNRGPNSPKGIVRRILGR